MNSENTKFNIPFRLLYTMIRVADLESSVAFYKSALGMNELRRENFTEGRFTLVFIGYGTETSNALIELTYNWDEVNYEIGTGYGHIALMVSDIYAACKRLENMDVKIVMEPGPLKGSNEIIAFVVDPDGYQIELINRPCIGN